MEEEIEINSEKNSQQTPANYTEHDFLFATPGI